MSPAGAAAAMDGAARAIEALTPQIVVKKIDSRLKGNIASETEALAAVIAPSRIVVAPAVPDQGRFTKTGMVVGAGIDRPLSIVRALAGLDRAFEIVDAADEDDLDALVAILTPGTLLVGARGLGAALARRLANPLRGALPRFEPQRRTLFAFGSRDPITAAQIAFLARRDPGIAVVDAPQGRLSPTQLRGLPAVLRCTGPMTEPARVAADFAEAIAAALPQLHPDTLVMGGGDTAMAVLSRLGHETIVPLGEAASGVPWFVLPLAHGATVRCLVKSGGFGNVDVLASLVPEDVVRGADGLMARIER
jgi:uncharacterized protein YgbK (DUF1537 family)